VIDFSLTPEQTDLIEMVQALMSKHAPEDYIARLDAANEYPYELWDTWAEAGLLGLPFPEQYGGQGGSIMDFVLVAEALGYWGYDMIGAYGTPLFMGLNILHNGSPELVKRWLPPLLTGERRFSVAMTEPEAGSDAAISPPK